MTRLSTEFNQKACAKGARMIADALDGDESETVAIVFVRDSAGVPQPVWVVTHDRSPQDLLEAMGVHP